MKNLIIFLILLALGISYTFWIDHDCHYGGYMTWQGKRCVDEDVKPDIISAYQLGLLK